MIQQTKTLGLALGSGGVRGLVHIGVIRGLIKNGIKIDFLAGSSIGAFVGAMYSARQNIDEIEKLILNGRTDAFFSLVNPSIGGGFIKGDKLEDLIFKWVGAKNFTELKTPLIVIATDLISGKPIVFENDNLLQAVHASMSVPVTFKPVRHNNMLLVDGGLSCPVPDLYLKEKFTPDVIISVNLDYRLPTIKNIDNYTNVGKVSLRSVNILRHYLAEYSIKNSDLILNPVLDEDGIIGLKTYLTSEKSIKAIYVGEQLINDNITKIQALLSS